MRLYLITHAHTYQDRDTEAAQWRLSEIGQKQAEILATQPFWVQVDRLVSLVCPCSENNRDYAD